MLLLYFFFCLRYSFISIASRVSLFSTFFISLCPLTSAFLYSYYFWYSSNCITFILLFSIFYSPPSSFFNFGRVILFLLSLSFFYVCYLQLLISFVYNSSYLCYPSVFASFFILLFPLPPTFINSSNLLLPSFSCRCHLFHSIPTAPFALLFLYKHRCFSLIPPLCHQHRYLILLFCSASLFFILL